MFVREKITRDIAIEYDSEQPIDGEKVVRMVFKDGQGIESKYPVTLQEMIRWGQVMNICAQEIQGGQPQVDPAQNQNRVVRGPDGQPVPIDAKLAKKLGLT